MKASSRFSVSPRRSLQTMPARSSTPCTVAGDEMLPSIRQLAKELQISVITTKRAYEELENEGMIYSVPQKGFFVTSGKVEILKEKRLKLIEDTAVQLINEGKAAGLSLDELKSMIELLWE